MAQGWLLIRSDGAWGSTAVESSVSKGIKKWAADRKYKILLVRQHLTKDLANGFQYWISQGSHEFRTGRLSSLSEIPCEADSLPAPPMLVICTNGSRDKCCAVEGIALRRSLDAELSVNESSQVWEGTHIGGHRFAPTGLYLPGNWVLGRLSIDSALQMIRHGDVPRDNVRGRSHLSPCHQVLEASMPNYWSITWQKTLEECPLLPHTHHGHADGNSVNCEMDIHAGPERSESCGAKVQQSINLRLSSYTNTIGAQICL